MDIFHILINGIVFSLNIIGVLITLRGVVIALGEFLKKELSGKKILSSLMSLFVSR